MLNLSRRSVLSSAAAAAAALGLSKPLIFAGPAFAAMPIEPTVGHYKYKVGSIEVTAVYDGIWRKPHDPAFIKGASVEETKAALAKAGLTTEFMPIPLTVVVLKIGDKHDHGRRRFGRRPVAGERHQSAGQYEGRGHRSQRDQHRPGLAFPSRPRLGPDGEGHQRADVSPMPNSCQQRRVQVLDRARPRRQAARRPQGRGQAHRRELSEVEELEARRGQRRSRARRPDPRTPTATRQAIRCSWSRPARIS